MSQPFDPYHVWLGIPPAEQPPTHYRLLALAEFEGAPEVIENAADRQMAHVRRAASGKHGDASQEILNEISAARRCLLNSEKKQQYDDELRAKRNPAAVNGNAKVTAAAPGIEATTEWIPTKPAKPPAAPPPRRPQAAPANPRLGDESDRWKGTPASEVGVSVAEVKSPVKVTAPSKIAQRTQGKKQPPWLLLAVFAGLAMLPILALLIALASMSSTTATTDGETPSTVATVDGAGTSGVADGVGLSGSNDPPLPVPTESGGSDPRPPVRPNNPAGNDNRDPLDDTPSFGTPSDPPDLKRGLTAYWKFDQKGIQRPTIDNAGVGGPSHQFNRAPASADAHLSGAVRNPILFWDHASWAERSGDGFTFALWFRPNSVKGSQSIAGKRALSAPDREWHLVRSNDRVFARFHDDSPENKETLIASPHGSVELNKWTLAVIRWDKAGRTDGFRQSLWLGNENGNALARSNNRMVMNIPITQARFGIGDDDSGVSLDGDIDEAAYWNRPLNNEEVQLYFNDGKGISLD